LGEEKNHIKWNETKIGTNKKETKTCGGNMKGGRNGQERSPSGRKDTLRGKRFLT